LTTTTSEIRPPAGVVAPVENCDPEARLRTLFDTTTLRLMAPHDDSGVLWARGRIDGAAAVAFATDAPRMEGPIGADGYRRIVEAIDTAIGERIPVLGLWHSAGGRMAEGVVALDALGRVFAAMVCASGRVPQIAVVLGPAVGDAAYGLALTDIVIMSGAGRIFVHGPEVVRSVTGERVDMADLGGPEPHGRRSGVAHITTTGDEEALIAARRLAALLGRQERLRPDDVPLAAESEHDLAAAMPAEANRAYDVKPLIKTLLDEPGVELHAKWAPNIVTTLGRLAGRTIGVIANNPLRLGGCLDASGAEKAARFVRMCDSLGVPLVVLVDVPGYLPGVGQEWNGVVRRGAKLLYAFAEAVVPRVTLVTRKAYGGAYIAMNSRALGATAVFAWPTAEPAVMGALAAVNILHRRALAAVDPQERETLRARLVAEHLRVTGGVDRAREAGLVDDVIKHGETRRRIAEALAAAPAVRGAHRNIPL
jgi:acetyl-CoA/propionyl-CoA carboxylase carboxyl transferase subunit